MTKTTLRLQAEDPEAVQRAAELLQAGKLVAFATETVYGLGANALDAKAVASVFAAKGRPAWDPLIVHVPDLGHLGRITQLEAETAERAEALAGAFWPGPLTMLLPRTAAVPDAVTAGRQLVGVRVPAHSSARALLRAAGVPVAAPSANRFGHVSPTTADHVLADLDGRIDAVLDAGACAIGVESTVLDPTQTPMVVYRAGAITAGEITSAGGVPAKLFEAGYAAAAPAALPSPGVGLRHYAPEIPVRLTEGHPDAFKAELRTTVASGRRVGVLLPFDWPTDDLAEQVVLWGRWDDPSSLAASLFACLRALEASGVDLILAPLPSPGGFGDALRDRLLKAAKPR